MLEMVNKIFLEFQLDRLLSGPFGCGGFLWQIVIVSMHYLNDTSDNELFKNFLRFQTYIICASTYFLDSPVGPVRHQISPDKDRKSLSNKLTTLNPSYLASTEMTAKPDSYRRVPENISCDNGQGFLLTT